MENSFRPWVKKGIEGEILLYQLKKKTKKKTGITIERLE